MSTPLPDECWETLPVSVKKRWPQRIDDTRRLEAVGGEELERREHAAVDDPGGDVAPPARVDLDAGLARTRLASVSLLMSRIWPTEPPASAPAPRARKIAVDSSRRQPSMNGSGSIRGTPLPGGRIEKRTCGACRSSSSSRADAAEDRARDDAAPGEHPLELELVALEADVAGEVRAQAGERGQRERRVEDLAAPAGGQRARPRRGWRRGAP